MKSLFAFYGLACLISWTIWFPLYGGALGAGAFSAIPLNHAAGGLGPLIAAFIMAACTDGRNGVKRLLRQCLQLQPLILLVIALAGPFLLAAIAAVVSHYIHGKPLDLSVLGYSAEFPRFSPAGFFIYNLIFFGFGEEAGWRGYALPLLQRNFNVLVSACLLTLFWACWHWPLFLYRPGYVQMDAGGITGWVFSLLTGSIILSWLFNRSRGSILICAVFHATIDIAFTAPFTDRHIVSYLGALITVWGIATALVYRTGYPARPVTAGANGN